MKNTKVKGFTLIELIVVIAIFSIIIASATSMMIPVSKAATETDVISDGSKVVENFAKVIEADLSTAEYMYVNTDISFGDSSAIQNRVRTFVDSYYGGVLKAGSSATSPTYARGQFHALQIEMATGKVSEWIYDVNNFGSISPSQTSYNEYAVNKTYYDKYDFEIKPGSYSTVEEFDSAAPTAADRRNAMSTEGIVFTIKATTTRSSAGNPKTEYSFVSSAATPMVNQVFGGIHSDSMKGIYYCVDVENTTEADGTSVSTNVIRDRAS